MYYLLVCSDDVIVCTDHRNLLFTLEPTAVEPSFGRHKFLKSIYWALYQSEFSYTIEHIPGEFNTMDKITTRWMQGCRRKEPVSGIVALFNVIPGQSLVPTAPTGTTTWPSRGYVQEVQNSISDHPHSLSWDRYDTLRMCNRSWVSSTTN